MIHIRISVVRQFPCNSRQTHIYDSAQWFGSTCDFLFLSVCLRHFLSFTLHYKISTHIDALSSHTKSHRLCEREGENEKKSAAFYAVGDLVSSDRKTQKLIQYYLLLWPLVLFYTMVFYLSKLSSSRVHIFLLNFFSSRFRCHRLAFPVIVVIMSYRHSTSVDRSPISLHTNNIIYQLDLYVNEVRYNPKEFRPDAQNIPSMNACVCRSLEFDEFDFSVKHSEMESLKEDW